MLQDGDLEAFLNAFIKSKDSLVAPASPRKSLVRDDGLFAPEIWRLGCSLQIAAVLGDAPQAAAATIQIILGEIRDVRCAPLEDQDAWTQAIAWARMQPAIADAAKLEVPLGREREAVVGAACLRLRKQGHKVEVGAYGPKIAERSRREIVRSAEALVALLGGLETASQVLRFLCEAKRHHDGMWLFGEVGLGTHDANLPMIPVGWLFSLALRYLDHSGGARKPEVAWKSLVNLAIDFAAAHDCQRYNQFTDLDPHPSQFHRILVNSLLWREFFTLPQVPPKALGQILDALASVLTWDDENRLGFSFSVLNKEILQLMDWSATDRLTVHSRAHVEKALPVLQRLTGGAEKSINVNDSDSSFGAGHVRDDVVLFACGQDRAVTLPCALFAAAVCERVFRLVWSKLGQNRASQITGKALERAIADAIRGKAPKTLTNHTYKVGRCTYELDVATCDDNCVVIIETKAKSLTQRSRSGDMFCFFKDYSTSFLAMLAQLVRHEIHLKQGRIPLTAADGAVADLRPVKVAVSPLSFGPVADKFLSGRLIRSLVGARFVIVAPDPANQGIMDAFNKCVEGIVADMAIVAPKKDGVTDLHSYLIDVFWLDLGQLLYILDRANTVSDAFWPLKHITFSSRDFWTELAYADRGGLTQHRWRPVPKW